MLKHYICFYFFCQLIEYLNLRIYSYRQNKIQIFFSGVRSDYARRNGTVHIYVDEFVARGSERVADISGIKRNA